MAWSGYVAGAGGPYTSVSATWVIPTINVSLSNTPGNFAIWVGLDGATNNFVEQTGVIGFVDPNGTVRWQGWSEYFPAGQAWFSKTAYPISAGDSVTASTVYTTDRGGTFTNTLINNTQGWTATAPRTNAALDLMGVGTPPRSTAEVVMEPDQPEDVFVWFNTVNFTNVTGLGSAPGMYQNYPAVVSTAWSAVAGVGSFSISRE
jgi:hypothetical protein